VWQLGDEEFLFWELVRIFCAGGGVGGWDRGNNDGIGKFRVKTHCRVRGEDKNRKTITTEVTEGHGGSQRKKTYERESMR
jgi:hypothetical protein